VLDLIISTGPVKLAGLSQEQAVDAFMVFLDAGKPYVTVDCGSNYLQSF
jgi:hypothetical protein